jgi:drug/metabolite transporter (DMT)-like permease
MSALPFLTWSLAGATAILSLVALLKKQHFPMNRGAIKYYFIAAFASVAGSNLIFYSAVSKVGVSFVALTISLPPLLTYLLALLLGMERFNYARAIGVSLAMLGTIVLVAAKWSSPGSNQLWLLITLLGPVLLAAGNIYRSKFWPAGASPDALAPGMLLAATITLLSAGIAMPGSSMFSVPSRADVTLIIVQAIVFAAQFSLLFVVQKIAGPVFLSLIGAISALFGIPFAVLILNETMLPALIPASTLIFLGMVFMLKQQFSAQRAI